MRENQSKREGLLLGTLNSHRHRAPTGMTPHDQWTPDGSPIRALGVPIGNHIDMKEWYLGRYRTVKARYGLWPSMRRLSITGRNLLLQSMHYGAFRFWLYSSVMPDEISFYLEQDAKHMLWSTNPHLILSLIHI